MLVAGFSAHTDVGRAHETANEVRRLAKQIQESQVMAQTYNNRERLFGNPITNVSMKAYNFPLLNSSKATIDCISQSIVLPTPVVCCDRKKKDCYPSLSVSLRYSLLCLSLIFPFFVLICSIRLSRRGLWASLMISIKLNEKPTRPNKLEINLC